MVFKGDSGGPIMKFIDNRWTLVGIVSNGDAGEDIMQLTLFKALL